MKTTSAFAGIAVLALVPAWFIACGDDPVPHSGRSATAPAPTGSVPEAENPDQGKWVDLRKHEFRPEWVGGTLVLFRNQAPPTLNNLLWTSGDARSFSKLLLYPFLLAENPDRVDGKLRLEPNAAEAMPVAKDERTWVWRLKPGLTWEDGEPVTAADYAFTFDLLRQKGIEADSRRASLERVESVRALDERTFEVRFRDVYYNSLVAFGLEFTVVPAHAVPKDPTEFNKLDRTLAFGPYRLAEQARERLVFELRPEYRTTPHPVGPHYIERIEVRFNKDSANKLQQLRSGTAHLDAMTHDQYVALADDDEFRRNCWRASYYMPAWFFCAWNLRDPSDPELERPHPLFGDVRVRRALGHLFPRERICAEYYHGLAMPVSGPFFFKESDNDPGVRPLAFDPAAASGLLAEAGWKLSARGFLEKDGREFRFTINHPQGPPWPQHVAAQFVEAARKTGIDVTVRDLPMDALEQALAKHSFDALLVINVVSPAIEPDVYEIFHSSQAKLGGQNWSGLANADVDRHIESYRQQPDPAKRLEIRRSLHRLIADIQPLSFLYSAATCAGVSRKWANVKVHDLGILYRDFVWRDLWEKHPPKKK